MFGANSRLAKKLHLLYNRNNEHYNVITCLKVAMAKMYICKRYDTLYDKTHKYDKFCSLCKATPPSTKDHAKDCNACNRRFLSEKCFQNHLTLKVKGKLVCQWRQVCRNCNVLGAGECLKKFCNNCNKKEPSGHFCYAAPLKYSKFSDTFFFVFFDTECTKKP